jgi:hypothetical protein
MATGVPAASVYTPAPHSLAALKRDVLNYVQGTQSDSDLNDLAQRAINNGIDRINSRNWKQLINKDTLTLVADDADYGLSNDFKRPITLLRLDSSSNRDGRLDYLPLQTFYNEHRYATASGDPRWYTIQHKQRLLLLDVPVGSAFASAYPTLELWYHRRIPHLTGDADRIDIPPEFERFIVNHAAAELAAMRGHQVLSFVRQEEELAWSELKIDDNNTATDWSERR